MCFLVGLQHLVLPVMIAALSSGFALYADLSRPFVLGQRMGVWECRYWEGEERKTVGRVPRYFLTVLHSSGCLTALCTVCFRKNYTSHFYLEF